MGAVFSGDFSHARALDHGHLYAHVGFWTLEFRLRLALNSHITLSTCAFFPPPEQKPKIPAAHRYIFSVNAPVLSNHNLRNTQQNSGLLRVQCSEQKLSACILRRVGVPFACYRSPGSVKPYQISTPTPHSDRAEI
jgi:hypothetical protein